ncbi:MAG: sigma-E factor negative regulatory protein [Rubrivivax sp.]|jgi:sigma-E factor negative regulatory protein RseA|nr:sigma-E factor negative regulatory protein [Rubrivivax sp.]
MENISALMDGEAEGQDAHQAFLRLGDNPETRESWDVYHLIGDVMRGETVGGNDVSRRVAEALSREPTVLAPVQARRFGSPTKFALSAAASVSAVAVVGWMAFSSSNIANPPVEIAQVKSIASTRAEAPLVSVPNDGQMNEYLLAHQGISPSTSLHGVAPYIRTISVAPAAER